MLKQFLVAALALSTVAGSVSPAAAEWFAGIYLGFASTADTDLTFTRRSPRTWEDVEFQTSPVWGVRGGYWLEKDLVGELAPYVGLGLDLTYFRPRIPTQTRRTEIGPTRLGGMDPSVVAISPEILLRLPLLVDKDHPTGRLQPYLGFGPSIFLTSSDDSGTFGSRGDSQSSNGVGVVFRPGIAWHMTEAVAVFAEYRLMHFSPRYEFTRGPVDVDITSHHFNFGILYTFGR